MKVAFLSAVGLLLSVATASAQDSLRIPIPFVSQTTAPVNRNNIRFVDFSVSDNGTREAMTMLVGEKELTPTYLDSYTSSSLWKQGWFLGASVSASAFVGDPIGCDDLFGRVKPGLQLSLGKWLVPSAGVRVSYQGYDMKSGMLDNQEYHAFMSDWMLDVASLFHKGETGPRATAIPYVGYGYMLNTSACSHSFGMHYGVIGALRLGRNIHLNLELSAMSTFKDFDGMGGKCRLGDNFLNASLGLSYTVGGRHSRQRVVDAMPYMEQNSRLFRLASDLSEVNRSLMADLNDRENTIREYRKILKLKGWLSAMAGDDEHAANGSDGGSGTDAAKASGRKVVDGVMGKDTSTGREGGADQDMSDRMASKVMRALSGAQGQTIGSSKTISYPYNNYSGLNSLRERLRNGTRVQEVASGYGKDGADGFSVDDSVSMTDSLALNDMSNGGDIALDDVWSDPACCGNPLSDSDAQSLASISGQNAEYLQLMLSGKAPVGAPILFFFQLGSTRLTDMSQLVNLKEIAQMAKTYHLRIRIVGAADSATGTPTINSGLSSARAGYIEKELISLGIEQQRIYKTQLGGIDRYSPSEANRNTRVELYL